MATHSSVLAWRIPGTGEPGGLPSMGFAQSRTQLKQLSSSSSIQHMELCSVLGGSLDGRGVLGRMDTFICMAESHHCSPETVTSMLISYIPIQNKTLKIKIKITDTIQYCEKSRDAYNPQHACVLSHAVISNSLQPNGLYPQAPLFTEFSSHKYWSRLPFLLQGISLTHGSNPCLSLASPALEGRFFTTALPGKPI